MRDERLRIGVPTQAEFGSLIGISAQVQSRYEKAEREPKMEYWAAVADIGVDVLYVITGRRDVTEMSADEQDLVRRYRDAPDVVKAAAIAALTAGAAPSSSKYQMNFGGATIGNQTVGDVKIKSRKVVGVDKKK